MQCWTHVSMDSECSVVCCYVITSSSYSQPSLIWGPFRNHYQGMLWRHPDFVIFWRWGLDFTNLPWNVSKKFTILTKTSLTGESLKLSTPQVIISEWSLTLSLFCKTLFFLFFFLLFFFASKCYDLLLFKKYILHMLVISGTRSWKQHIHTIFSADILYSIKCLHVYTEQMYLDHQRWPTTRRSSQKLHSFPQMSMFVFEYWFFVLNRS